MRIQFFFALFFFFLLGKVYSQSHVSGSSSSAKKNTISETSVVKDTSGTIYQPDIWKKLLLTGYYKLKAENPNDKNTAFILTRLTEEQRENYLSRSKPAESKYFTTGKEVKNFSATDINGKKYKLKDLKGKIVVLNFWFINCPPCRLEIQELNKLVHEFKDSSNIVFLAIALDSKDDLKGFLKSNPFNYIIIDNGREIATQYDVTSYPTHVVIDQQGNAYFHTSGTGSTTVYWLKKSIEALLKLNKNYPD
jgi:peroxiredoxin